MTQQRVPQDTGGGPTDEYAYMTQGERNNGVSRVFQADSDHPFAATAGFRGGATSESVEGVYSKPDDTLYAAENSNVVGYSVPDTPTGDVESRTVSLPGALDIVFSISYNPANDTLVLGGVDRPVRSRRGWGTSLHHFAHVTPRV